MLPEKLQEVLKHEGKLLDPKYLWPEEEGEPNERVFNWSQHDMGRYKQYANFLEACGHYTLDLLGALEPGCKLLLRSCMRLASFTSSSLSRTHFLSWALWMTAWAKMQRFSLRFVFIRRLQFHVIMIKAESDQTRTSLV